LLGLFLTSRSCVDPPAAGQGRSGTTTTGGSGRGGLGDAEPPDRVPELAAGFDRELFQESGRLHLGDLLVAPALHSVEYGTDRLRDRAMSRVPPGLVTSRRGDDTPSVPETVSPCGIDPTNDGVEKAPPRQPSSRPVPIPDAGVMPRLGLTSRTQGSSPRGRYSRRPAFRWPARRLRQSMARNGLCGKHSATIA
jgi:hypothetical protein